MKKYKHAKIRNNSSYIQIQATLDNVRYRFSTKYVVNAENLEYVEKNYRTIIMQYQREKDMQEQKHIDTITEYGYKVLELERENCKKSTLIRYENVFKKHIVSSIGNMRLQEFSPKIMKVIFKDKFSHLSFKNKGIAICVLRKIFDYAICDEIFTDSNPMQIIKHKKKEYVEPQRLNEPLNLNQVMDILEHLKAKQMDNRIKMYFQLALLTGMRVNEILALKYSDINVEKNTIQVYKSLQQGTNTISTTKTENGKRNIQILPFLKSLLKDTLDTNGSGYIFLNKRGGFISDSTMRKYFKKILQELNIGDRTLYSTRHTFASIMIAYGEDIAWVSKMLGHKDIATTCNFYVGHIRDDKTRGLCFLEYEKKHA